MEAHETTSGLAAPPAALNSFVRNRPDKDDSRERNRAFALGEFLRVCGVACDEMVALKLKKLAAARSEIKRKRFLVFKRCELLARFCEGRIVTNPNFARFRIEPVLQAQRYDLVAIEQKIRRFRRIRRVGSVCLANLLERVAVAMFVVGCRHGGSV